MRLVATFVDVFSSRANRLTMDESLLVNIRLDTPKIYSQRSAKIRLEYRFVEESFPLGQGADVARLQQPTTRQLQS